MDNTFSFNTTESTAPLKTTIPSETTAPVQKEVRLVDVAVTDATVALNLMASFLNVAQRRGTFSIDESAKIWECLKIFTVPSAESTA